MKKKPQDLLDESTDSYMCMRFHAHGGETKELRIPTFWDETRGMWIGVLKTPYSKTLITFQGVNSFDLQNDCNIKLREVLEKNDDLSKEVFSMFKKIT